MALSSIIYTDNIQKVIKWYIFYLNLINISTYRLQKLNVSENAIYYVPLEIFQVPSIEEIQMQGNKITNLNPADNLSRMGDLGKLVHVFFFV